MANTYKSIYRANPAGATNADSGALTNAVIISTINVANLSSSAATFRVAISPTGAGVVNSDYFYYDVAIPGNDTFQATAGIAVQSGAIIRIYASTANLAFNFNGVEIT